MYYRSCELNQSFYPDLGRCGPYLFYSSKCSNNVNDRVARQEILNTISAPLSWDILTLILLMEYRSPVMVILHNLMVDS